MNDSNAPNVVPERSSDWVKSALDNRIGIVAIGRNEGARLELCLASLEDWTNVVYVDSASTDQSVEVARKHGVQVLVLSNDRMMTAARGRNAGAHSFDNHREIEFVQFIDGDCELIPSWLAAAATFLDDHPKAAAVCGLRMERHPEASIYNKLADREWNTAIGEAESTGGDALVRISAFRDVGGFRDDQLAHEEPEFCSRLRGRGWQIWRIDQPMTTHDAATFSARDFYRRSRRAGMGMAQAVFRPGSHRDTASRSILTRAVIWAAVLPVGILLLAAIDWRLSIAGLAIYPLQWLRIAIREHRDGYFTTREAAKVAALSLVGKFAELDGAIRSTLRHLLFRKGD